MSLCGNFRRAAVCFGKGGGIMALDARLRAVAALVPPGCRAADIGSDHAHLAMELWQTGRVSHVIAADKHAGPCSAARRTLSAAGLTSTIPVRQGDGLSVLAPGEVETVCIAGMGGALIAAILAAVPEVLGTISRLVLQPMNDAPLLRRWLYAHDWHLAAETLAEAEGRLYEVLAAEPGAASLPEQGLLLVGPCLWAEKPPLLKKHVEALLVRARRRAAGMEKSPAAMARAEYRHCKEEIAALEAKRIW